VEELRRLAFKRVTDKLQHPSQNEERQRPPPQAVEEESASEDGY